MAVGRVDAAAAGEVGLVDVRGLALRRHPRDVVAQVGGEVVGVAEAEEVSDLVERRRLEVVCAQAQDGTSGDRHTGQQQQQQHIRALGHGGVRAASRHEAAYSSPSTAG